MKSITVEGVTLHYVPTIPAKFDCNHCAMKQGDQRCVRMCRRNGELYFEKRSADEGHLFCIHNEDIVFINDTPEDIARYVAARLEAT